MSLNSCTGDGEPTEIELTTVNNIPNEDVARRYSGQEGIEAIVRDADEYGNILNAILIDGDTYAYATRRDDCYNQDGSRPNWSIRTAGELAVIDTPERWERASDAEMVEWTVGRGGVDVEALNITTDGHMVVEIYYPYEGDYSTITFEFK